MQDRKQRKSIPQIVQELRKQGIKISNAQALRIINPFQSEERAARAGGEHGIDRILLSVLALRQECNDTGAN
ncbi:MAG: hypothetical protein JOZ31_23160 [Verrucomicrobia bacterium]|nr:hypothetical protein [Verrucomicrobiota bacterium]MBV8481384.1 hypothetical protein [Verrucomicrobiota bacterium]